MKNNNYIEAHISTMWIYSHTPLVLPFEHENDVRRVLRVCAYYDEKVKSLYLLLFNCICYSSGVYSKLIYDEDMYFSRCDPNLTQAQKRNLRRKRSRLIKRVKEQLERETGCRYDLCYGRTLMYR